MVVSIEIPPRASIPLTIPRCALTIAGSDSGGGAGIQADLRTFAAHGLLGTTAITAITAQNTLGVRSWEGVTPDLVAAQIEAVLSDLPVSAVKTGMLGNQAIIEAVARVLPADLPLVVDPVMVSTSGHRLLEPEAEAAMVSLLLPRATVLTPNLHEAAVLSGLALEAPAEDHATALAVVAPRAWIVIKGGHRVQGSADTDPRCAVDLIRSPSGELTRVTTPWIETTSTHGTGCTLSAAIASQLALGHEAPDVLGAIIEARRYLLGALSAALPMGQGHGPVNHLFALEKSLG